MVGITDSSRSIDLGSDPVPVRTAFVLIGFKLLFEELACFRAQFESVLICDMRELKEFMFILSR